MDNPSPTDIDLETGVGGLIKSETPLTIKVEGKEKRHSAKKPPRPTKVFSLDAADQKLIQDLTQLAKMKRASIQRIKAFEQKKASSSSGSLFAMLFTLIFFLMMFFQGMSCRSSGVTSHGSPQTAPTNDNGLVFIQEQLNPSASDSILPHSKSSKLFDKISGSSLARRKEQ